MNEQQLRAQLKGLAHPSALLRRQATLGVFALLLKATPQQLQQQQQLEVVQDVLLTCLTDPHPVSAPQTSSSTDCVGLVLCWCHPLPRVLYCMPWLSCKQPLPIMPSSGRGNQQHWKALAWGHRALL